MSQTSSHVLRRFHNRVDIESESPNPNFRFWITRVIRTGRKATTNEESVDASLTRVTTKPRIKKHMIFSSSYDYQAEAAILLCSEPCWESQKATKAAATNKVPYPTD